MNNSIFMPGNTPSSKNSRITNTKTGMSFASPLVVAFKKNTRNHWLNYKGRYGELTKEMRKPYSIGIFFVRDSKRKFDWINACQIIQDLMVEYDWISDDNCAIMVPFPLRDKITGLFYAVDKWNAGCYIKPLREKQRPLIQLNGILL